MVKKDRTIDKYLNERNINHYSFTFDLMEYDFKNIYKTFNISYFSKDDDLFNHNFVDSQELKYYEKIEEIKKDLVVILIKKFKLRLSLRKNTDFSKDIIISDDYDFDPSILKFDKYIIKIAIVKDNLAKWGNLENYDYIFTSDEHIGELNEFDMVYPIDEKPVFNQIKFILNYLYKRNLDKFYYFVKEVSFHNVFPKWKYYFVVLNSDYFDDEWYRDTYEIEENTDSIVHFLLIGYKKGYDPGPNFSTSEYYECHWDVNGKGVNPLVHYEMHGKKENRIISVSQKYQRDYDLISNSEYFDKDWYVSTYDILSEDDDPVNHYLTVGYIKRYNPGPNFNTNEYYLCNKDIMKILMNPLLHYELYGRKVNRKIGYSDEHRQRNSSIILNSPYFDEEWYNDNYGPFSDDMDPSYHYLNIGFAKGYNPSPNFNTNEYYECNPDIKEAGVNPLLNYEQFGRKQGRKISFNDKS